MVKISILCVVLGVCSLLTACGGGGSDTSPIVVGGNPDLVTGNSCTNTNTATAIKTALVISVISVKGHR